MRKWFEQALMNRWRKTEGSEELNHGQIFPGRENGQGQVLSMTVHSEGSETGQWGMM